MLSGPLTASQISAQDDRIEEKDSKAGAECAQAERSVHALPAGSAERCLPGSLVHSGDMRARWCRARNAAGLKLILLDKVQTGCFGATFPPSPSDFFSPYFVYSFYLS